MYRNQCIENLHCNFQNVKAEGLQKPSNYDAK